MKTAAKRVEDIVGDLPDGEVPDWVMHFMGDVMASAEDYAQTDKASSYHLALGLVACAVQVLLDSELPPQEVRWLVDKLAEASVATSELEVGKSVAYSGQA